MNALATISTVDYRTIFCSLAERIEGAYSLKVNVGPVTGSYTGQFDGKEIWVDLDRDPEEAVFILVHLFGSGVPCSGTLKMVCLAMAKPYPTFITGLRSPFDRVNGLVYFGRMLDKIRLAAAGKLPEDWQAARGTTMKGSFDSRCCRFLHIDYAALEKETLKGGSDAELVAWAFAHGRRPSEEEIEVWNGFMTKRGWRDAGTQRLNERLAEIGLAPGTVQTMFEFIDLDEGRRQAGPG